MLTQFINPFLKAIMIITIIGLTMLIKVYAQTDNNKNNKQIHIKMMKEENGKRTEIDTTFNNSEDADAFMKSFNDDSDNDDDNFNFNYNSDDADKKIKSFNFNFHDDSISGKNKNFNLNMSIPNWSDEDRAKFEADMKKLKEEMKDKNLFDFHWDTSSMGNNFNYNFNFKMPDEKEMEELKEKLNDMKFDFDFDMPSIQGFNMPPMPNFNYDVQGLNDADKKQFEEQMKKAEEEYKKAMDLLKEKNGNIQSPPCPHSFNFNYNYNDDDKADKKAQKKVIIIQKSDSKTDKNKSSKKTKIEESASAHFKINDLKYFPNPNNGKFDLSFSMPTRGDLNISITDEAGKKIYNENMLDFTGDYNQSFDISAHGTGVYLLSISQGKEWMHKKVVVK